MNLLNNSRTIKFTPIHPSFVYIREGGFDMYFKTFIKDIVSSTIKKKLNKKFEYSIFFK